MTDNRNDVCIPKSVLWTLRAYHVMSAIDLSVAVPPGITSSFQCSHVTGYTEWASDWRDAHIFVNWDWGVMSNMLFVLNPAQLRTNLQLLAADGRVEPLLVTKIWTLEWIELLPWREVVLARALRKM